MVPGHTEYTNRGVSIYTVKGTLLARAHNETNFLPHQNDGVLKRMLCVFMTMPSRVVIRNVLKHKRFIKGGSLRVDVTKHVGGMGHSKDCGI